MATSAIFMPLLLIFSVISGSNPNLFSSISMLWMIWRYEKDKVLRYVLCVLFALVIVMVGVSRNL